MKTAELFSELWLPKRPYCTDKLSDGIVRRDRDTAMGKLHIESNPRNMKRLITCDKDSAESVWEIKEMAYDLQIIPPPLFITTGLSGNSHIGWMLNGFASSPKALYAFDRIKDALTELTGSDRCYTGLLVRNPLHENQITEWDEAGADLTFADFRKYTDKVTSIPKKEFIAGEGRNTELFDKGRDYGYKLFYQMNKYPERYRDTNLGGRIEEFIMETNIKLFPQPLNRSEIRSIARSIEKFILIHFNYEEFEKKQAAGRIKGNQNSIISRQSDVRDRYMALKEIREEAGVTLKEACEQLNVSYKTARNNWKKWQGMYGN